MSPLAGKLEVLRALPNRLRDFLAGQDPVIAAVCERIHHAELGLTPGGRPKASFLFLGPTGVGKTELTLRFTEEIFGAGHLARFDLSEYQTVESLVLLLGNHEFPGRIAQEYDACGGAGTLLLDEVEKAHPRVLDILLQITDAARLTTGSHRVLTFANWYVVLTSNIGAQRIMAMQKSKYETMERLVRQDAQRELRPEIFARLSLVTVFNRLDYPVQLSVAARFIASECAHLRALGHDLTIDDSVREIVVARGYHERLGARPMRDAAEVLIRNAVAEALFLTGTTITGRLMGDRTSRSLRIDAPGSRER